MIIGVIAAQSRNGVIGRDGQIPWGRIPEDMSLFRKVTAGHTVIMGRKTWESLPAKFRPLPNRVNVVMSTQPAYRAEGATVVSSFDAVLAYAEQHARQAWVIGGQIVYEQAMPLCDIAVITTIDGDFEGDTSLPPLTARLQTSNEIMRYQFKGMRICTVIHRRSLGTPCL